MKDIGGGRQDGRGKEAHTGRQTGWKVGRKKWDAARGGKARQ